MISVDELRNINIEIVENGYDRKEVDRLLDEAADTIDDDLRKLEFLANKIEEYRAEEDIIKTAIIKAEKTAEEIRVDAKEKATALLEAGEAKVGEIIDGANEKAEEIVAKAQSLKDEAEKLNETSKQQAEALISEARERAAEIIREKSEEANAIVADAEKKANDAISSSKVIAQDILDQAKAISEDLIEKSKEEKEAYELLISALKGDAQKFLDNIKALYAEQLEILGGAKLDVESEEKIEKEEALHNLENEIESLVSETEEMESAIPSSISIEQPVNVVEAEAPAEEESVIDFDAVDVEKIEMDDEVEEIVEEEAEAVIEEVEIETTDDVAQTEEDEEPADPMEAVAAFSKSNDEENGSLFDNDGALPFESFFKVETKDAHGDKDQVISLVPPEDDEEDDEPKFRGFFKRKK